MDQVKVYRGRVFSPISDPFASRGDIASTYRSWDDGFVAVGDDGRFAAVGAWSDAPRDVEIINLGAHALITSTCSHAADASLAVGGSGANIAAL